MSGSSSGTFLQKLHHNQVPEWIRQKRVLRNTLSISENALTKMRFHLPRQRGQVNVGPAHGTLTGRSRAQGRGRATLVFFLPMLPRAGHKMQGRGRAAGDMAAGSGHLRSSSDHRRDHGSVPHPSPGRAGAGEERNDRGDGGMGAGFGGPFCWRGSTPATRRLGRVGGAT